MPVFDPSSSSSSSSLSSLSSESSSHSSFSISSDSSYEEVEEGYFDHFGENWVPQDGEEVYGVHYNVDNFYVKEGVTINISATPAVSNYNGLLGSLIVDSNNAYVSGRIDGNSSGYSAYGNIGCSQNSNYFGWVGGYGKWGGRAYGTLGTNRQALQINGIAGYSINTTSTGAFAEVYGYNADFSVDRSVLRGGCSRMGNASILRGGGKCEIYASGSIYITPTGQIDLSGELGFTNIGGYPRPKYYGSGGGCLLYADEVRIESINSIDSRNSGALVVVDYSGGTTKIFANSFLASEDVKSELKKKCGRFFIKGSYLKDGLRWGEYTSYVFTAISSNELEVPNDINNLKWSEWTLEGTTTPADSTGEAGQLKIHFGERVVSPTIDLMGAVGEQIASTENQILGGGYVLEMRGWTQSEADTHNSGEAFDPTHDETDDLAWEIPGAPPFTPNWRYMQMRISES